GAGAGGEANLSGAEQAFVATAAADLQKAKADGAAVVAVGPTAAKEAHALGHAINQALGAAGKTITYVEDPAGDRPSHVQAISDLYGRMSSGRVRVLLILGGNPVFDAPV